MNKVELQGKADALAEEINFLRALYEAVSGSWRASPSSCPVGPTPRALRDQRRRWSQPFGNDDAEISYKMETKQAKCKKTS